jgi:glutamyl/glutaminyl-tRNA synthetase
MGLFELGPQTPGVQQSIISDIELDISKSDSKIWFENLDYRRFQYNELQLHRSRYIHIYYNVLLVLPDTSLAYTCNAENNEKKTRTNDKNRDRGTHGDVATSCDARCRLSQRCLRRGFCRLRKFSAFVSKCFVLL